MEKIILDKLNWDLHMATPLDFLHIVSEGLFTFFLASVSVNKDKKKKDLDKNSTCRGMKASG